MADGYRRSPHPLHQQQITELQGVIQQLLRQQASGMMLVNTQQAQNRQRPVPMINLADDEDQDLVYIQSDSEEVPL